MSFFIKPKQSNGLSKFSTHNKGKRKFNYKKSREEEITSSEDEGEKSDSVFDHVSSENEEETPQEKKLRLAKIYLEEIAKEEQRRVEDKEVSKELISQRLRNDHLREIGKYEINIADKLKQVDSSQISFMKCREQHNTVTCLCISSDDNWLYTGSKDGIVVKWSLKERKKVSIIPFVRINTDVVKGHIGCIYSLAISTDRKFLVVGDTSTFIQIWDAITLFHIKTLKGHKQPVTGLCFKTNSHTLYSSSFDRSVRVWSLDEMAFVETLFGHQDAVTSIDVLNTDRPVSGGGRDGTVRLWKVSEDSQLLFNASGNIDCVRFINASHFLSGGDDGQVSLWSAIKKKPLCSVKSAHGLDSSNELPHWITSVAALVHSDVVASGSRDGYIRLWKVEDRYRKMSPLFQIAINGFVNHLAFTSDGKNLVAGVGRDHRLGRWSSVKSARNGVYIIPLEINN